MFVLLLTHVCAVVDEVEQVAAEYPDSRVSMSVAPYILLCGTIDSRRPMCGYISTTAQHGVQTAQVL
jgi:hypothetical protein